MRSHEAVTVPVTSTRWRLGTRHHMLGPGRHAAGHAGRTMRAPRWGVCGHGRARRPETARPAVRLRAVRTFTPGFGRYGISPSPSGYLASEHAT